MRYSSLPRRFLVIVTAVFLAYAAPPAAQQPVGTGRINGQVVAADNGAPVKRTTVTLVGRPMPLPGGRGSGAVGGMVSGVPGGVVSNTQIIVRDGAGGSGTVQQPPAATTDENGRFDFTDLTAGRYSLMINPQGGFVRPSRPQMVDVGDGAAQVTIKLERTGAITGRVLDESGDPLPRARVSTRPVGNRYMGMSPSGGNTDDLGQFRLFDVPPGEYYVTARLDAYGPVSAPGTVGFAPTYYPGVALPSAAKPVKVRSGQDTPGIDFSLLRVPLGRVTGTVRDASGQVVARANGGPNVSVMLVNRVESFAETRGTSPMPDGTFTINGVAPGEYFVAANIFGGNGPDATREGAYVPVVVNGDEQRVEIRTNHGATLSGRIVIEGTPPPPPPNAPPGWVRPGTPRIMVHARPSTASNWGAMTALPPRPAEATEDGTFELVGVRGSVILLAMGGPVLKAIHHGASDVTGKALELKGTERLTDFTVVLTWESGRLEGIVTDDSGQPAREAWVVVFPADSSKWFANSPFVHQTRTFAEAMNPPPALAGRVRPRPPGGFMTSNLLPGTYFIAAVQGADSPMGMLDAETLVRLRKIAVRVTVAAGVEPTTVQLRAAKSF